jgi:hypothetical protein
MSKDKMHVHSVGIGWSVGGTYRVHSVGVSHAKRRVPQPHARRARLMTPWEARCLGAELPGRHNPNSLEATKGLQKQVVISIILPLDLSWLQIGAGKLRGFFYGVASLFSSRLCARLIQGATAN